MAAHRYWRLVGFAVAGAGSLELSEVQLYAGGARVGDTVVPTCPFAPTSGALADLSDGLTTGVVAWPASAHRAPGFALVWDLTGAGADVNALRLGSGNSAASFPLDFTVQYSDDGLVWATWRDYSGLAYPGGLGWTVDPAVVVSDSDFGETALLLHFDGADGSTTLVDNSPSPKTVTANGNANISTAQSKFGGSSIYMSGVNNDYVSIANSASLGLAGVDFTVEGWVYCTAYTAGNQQLFTKDGIAGVINPSWAVSLSSTGKVNAGVGPGGMQFITGAITVALSTWTHIAFVRAGTTLKIYVSGVLDVSATQTATHADGSLPVLLGTQQGSTAVDRFRGYIDDLRITKGIARYTANFTPPTEPFPNNYPAPPLAPYLPRLRSADAMPSRMQGASLPNGAASSHLREYAFFDAYHGGLGIIYGTVKEKQTPANAPLRRKVWLLDERSGLVIRETWSDAATGAYEFRGIKQGVPYTVLAYDHAHNYRAFAGDNLLPDPMP